MKFKSDPKNAGKLLKFPTNYKPPEEKPKEANFAMFAFAIVGGQIGIAAQILEQILNLDEKNAYHAAEYYHACYQKDHGIQSRAMQIRILIQQGDNNGALMAIHECFGLQGPPAITVLESMRAMLS
ncbi:hypothetical protein [Pseudobacteriovorax antillogorgiicola]|uniref:Tetratricopeptide repeat-containing protein n=1 Tax=Pseudobacteriovorax antillogorgiicola TaxID=1513793 RepID=A0A1Y6CLP6_9BACT|nr:hypothetical protein [Pseudobacteriovorax antillogorgiicola]TCS45439.1 hypothetical protein EDD56_12850 [Pseudobacteriovorax antillogorgiicola]SMF74521.1 hypothetical protein SAMN06296036_12850 [Pseudobacteriovorax antillogorgiicola]